MLSSQLKKNFFFHATPDRKRNEIINMWWIAGQQKWIEMKNDRYSYERSSSDRTELQKLHQNSKKIKCVINPEIQYLNNVWTNDLPMQERCTKQPSYEATKTSQRTSIVDQSARVELMMK